MRGEEGRRRADEEDQKYNAEMKPNVHRSEIVGQGGMDSRRLGLGASASSVYIDTVFERQRYPRLQLTIHRRPG